LLRGKNKKGYGEVAASVKCRYPTLATLHPLTFSKGMDMENPCDKCLIKVNCTQVCFDKRNYRRLLVTAITQTGNGKRHIRSPRQKNHINYIRLLTDSNLDEQTIINRASVALMGN